MYTSYKHCVISYDLPAGILFIISLLSFMISLNLLISFIFYKSTYKGYLFNCKMGYSQHLFELCRTVLFTIIASSQQYLYVSLIINIHLLDV